MRNCACCAKLQLRIAPFKNQTLYKWLCLLRDDLCAPGAPFTKEEIPCVISFMQDRDQEQIRRERAEILAKYS